MDGVSCLCVDGVGVVFVCLDPCGLIPVQLKSDASPLLAGAMITGEWYMRHQHFSGWGRPFEFNSLLFSNAGRHEEARDTARIALRMPWWTLSLGFSTVRDMAQLQVCGLSYILM